VDVEHVHLRGGLPVTEGVVLGHHVGRIEPVGQRGPVPSLRIVGRRRMRQFAESLVGHADRQALRRRRDGAAAHQQRGAEK
jgi:hypothetical protein